MQEVSSLCKIGQRIDRTKAWAGRLFWLWALVAGTVSYVVSWFAHFDMMTLVGTIIGWTSAVVMIVSAIVLLRREQFYVGIAKAIIGSTEFLYIVPIEAVWNKSAKLLTVRVQLSTPRLDGIGIDSPTLDLYGKVNVIGLVCTRKSEFLVCREPVEVTFEKTNVNEKPSKDTISYFGISFVYDMTITPVTFRGVLEVKE